MLALPPRKDRGPGRKAELSLPTLNDGRKGGRPRLQKLHQRTGSLSVDSSCFVEPLKNQ